jgi:hypothetical protein
VRRTTSTSNLAGQKAWTFIDLSAAPDSLGTSLPQFIVQAASVNPLLAVEQLLWGGVQASPSPGAANDAFTVTVDLRRAFAATSGPDQKPFAAALAAQIAAIKGKATIDVAVRLDPSGRIAELRYSPPGAGLGILTLTLSHYGSPINITVPSQDQLTELTSLLPKAERENNGGGDGDGG